MTQQQHARLRCFFSTTPLTISGLTFFAVEIHLLCARLLFANESGFFLTAGVANEPPPSSPESFSAVNGPASFEGEVEVAHTFDGDAFDGDTSRFMLVHCRFMLVHTAFVVSIVISSAVSARSPMTFCAFAAALAAFRSSRCHQVSTTNGTSYFPSALTLSHMAIRMVDARSSGSPPASFFLPTVRTRRISGIWPLLHKLAFLPHTRFHASLKLVSMNLRRAFESTAK